MITAVIVFFYFYKHPDVIVTKYVFRTIIQHDVIYKQNHEYE